MRHLAPLLCLVLLLIFCSCSKKAYHQAAQQTVVDQILHGMEETYQAHGMDTGSIGGKSHRNLAYRLALHLNNESSHLQQIQSGADVEQALRSYARQTIARVERQRPGYPIVPIFQTLLDSDRLSQDQAVLLLACTAQLISESEITAEAPGLKR